MARSVTMTDPTRNTTGRAAIARTKVLRLGSHCKWDSGHGQSNPASSPGIWQLVGRRNGIPSLYGLRPRVLRTIRHTKQREITESGCLVTHRTQGRRMLCSLSHNEVEASGKRSAGSFIDPESQIAPPRNLAARSFKHSSSRLGWFSEAIAKCKLPDPHFSLFTFHFAVHSLTWCKRNFDPGRPPL